MECRLTHILPSTMSTLTEAEPKLSSIDAAKQLQLAFDVAHLRIRDVQARFNSRTLEPGEDAVGRRGSGSLSNSPDALAAEVTDYMVCFLHPLCNLLYLIFVVVLHAQAKVPVPRAQCQRQIRENHCQ
jgi:hypothetical protein